MTVQIPETNQYRFVWVDPKKPGVQKGIFLFNDPSQAKEPLKAMKTLFSNFIIWLEDRENNRVEIPS